MSKSLIIVAALAVSTFATITIQPANADDESNGNDPKSCTDHQHFDSTNCSKSDSTPFILPFP